MPISDSTPLAPLVTLQQLVFLHTVAIAEFGGAEGVRDRGQLEAALARPLAGFGETRFHPTACTRAAALMEALIQYHGFVDGNKRTAVLAAAFWLEQEGYTLIASQEDVVVTALAVAEHRLSLDELVQWFACNSRLCEQ